MKTIIRSLTTAALALAALFVTGSARAVDAPTPLVMWDEDFASETKNGFTLSVRGGEEISTDKSYVEIKSSGKANAGLSIIKSDDTNIGTSATGSIIFKVSNLPSSIANAFLISLRNSGKNDPVGIFLDNSTSGVLKPALISGGNKTATRGTEFNNDSGTHKFAVVRASTSALNFYEIVDGVPVTLATFTGTNTNPSPFSGFVLGGMWAGSSDGIVSATGMKIDAVAVFSEILTADQAAAYEFPSDAIYTGKVISINVGMSSDVSGLPENYGSVVSGKDYDTYLGTIPGATWAQTGAPSGSAITTATGNKVYNVNSGETETLTQAFTAHTWATQAGNYAYYAINNSGGIDSAKTSDISENHYYLCVYPSRRDRTSQSGYFEVTGIPFETYDVYAYFQGSQVNDAASETQFPPIKVTNGNSAFSGGYYKVDSTTGKLIPGTTYTEQQAEGKWGSRMQTTYALGVNLVKIPNCSGNLKLEYRAFVSGPCAVQIVERIVEGPTKATATLTPSVFGGDWGNIQWDNNVPPTADLPAEITVAEGGEGVLSFGSTDGIVAKGITFKGVGSVSIMADGGYNGGLITSTLPISIVTLGEVIDIDAGANAITYQNNGSEIIAPTLTTTGAFTVAGSWGGFGGPVSLENVTAGSIVIEKDAKASVNAKTLTNVSGAGTLIKTGSGTLNLNGGNAVNGTTVQIDAGTVTLNSDDHGATLTDVTFKMNGGNLGVFGWPTINGTLTIINENAVSILSKNFNGNAAIVKQGAGTLTFNAGTGNTSSYITAEAGTLILNKGDRADDVTVNALKVGAGTIQIQSNQSLVVLSELDLTNATSTPVTGEGTLNVSAARTFKFPSTLEPDTPFTLCTGALTVPADPITTNVYVGDEVVPAIVTFNTTDKTITYAEIPPKTWSGEAGGNWSDAANWGGTLPASGDVVKLASTDVINVDSAAVLTGISVIGSGTLIFEGTGNTLPTMPSGITSETWNGNVWLKGYGNDNSLGLNLETFGNINSTVTTTGLQGYLTQYKNGTVTKNGAWCLKDGDSNVLAYKANNGGSSNYVNLPKLTGDGTFSDSNNTGANPHTYNFADGSEFYGNIELNYGRSILFGGQSINLSAKQIKVAANASATIAENKHWTAAGGIVIDGTIGGAGTLGSNTTFGNGAIIDADAGVLTASGTVTFGSNLKVKIASVPVGGEIVKIMNGSFTPSTISCNVVGSASPFALRLKSDGVYLTSTAPITLNLAGEQTLSTLAADVEGKQLIFHTTGASTLTLDSAIAPASIAVTGSAALTIKNANNVASSILAAANLSGFTGALTYEYDCTTANLTADDALKNLIKNAPTKVTFVFKGANAFGATLDFSASNGSTLATHLVFDGGTHTLKYKRADSGFSTTSTAENPVVLVKGNTTLTFNANDLTYWSGSYIAGGVIRVNDGGVLNIADINSGTFYYRQQFYLDPGATMNVNDWISSGNPGFRLQGGTGNDVIYVPASAAGNTKVATINGNIHMHTDSTIGFGVNVGENSILSIGSMTSADPNNANYKIVKRGAGKLVAAGDFNINTIEVADGSLAAGGTIKSITLAKATEIEVSSGTATISAISGNFAITKTGAGTLNLPAAYTQAVTLEEGLITATASNTITITGDIDLAAVGSANLPLDWTLSATDNDGSLKLPAGFAFGQIAKASAIPAGLTFKDSTGATIATDKLEIDGEGYINLKKSEIVIPYDVNGAVVVEGNLTFGTGGSINILNDGASLTVNGALELPAEGQLPINITLKGEYAKDTAFTIVTAQSITKGGAAATIGDFKLGTVTLLEGTTGELQLTDNVLKFVITSDTITAAAADVLNNGHLVRRFDANRGVTTGANNKVTAWTDLTGANAAESYSAGQVNDQPTLVSGGLRNYLDFGTTGSGRDLRFERLTNAKTVIEVLDIEPKQNAFLLGDNTNYHFHRGGNGEYGASNNAKFSVVRDNGTQIDNWSNTVIPTGFRVISLKLSQDCAADCFSSDRNGCDQGRTGGRKLCELLIFDTELSDSDFEAVEAYLTSKWALEYKNEATLVAGDNRWSTLNWGADKSYVPGSPIEITIGADNARLIYDDTTIPVDSIIFKNEDDYTYTTAYGADFGAKTIAAGETMTIVGSTDPASPLVYAGALTVNGILKTEGYVKLSNDNGNVVAAAGTFEIVGGVTEAIFPDKGMKGTLTIDPNATFKPYGRVDAIDYGGTTTVNVYGTLDMSDASARWTLRRTNTMNFYAGSTCTGAGQTSGNNHGALQFNNSADCVLNFLKKDGVGGTVDFSVVLHAQNAFTMNVEDGVIVNMSGSLGTGKNPFTLTGAGTINLTSAYDFSAPVTIGAGTTLIIDGGSCAGGYTNNGTIDLKNGTLNIGAVRDLSQWGTVIYEQGVISATATPAEYGEGAASFTNLPASLTTLKFIVNGVEQTLEVSGGKATYSGPVVIDGAATWLDYTFTKDTLDYRKQSQANIKNAGSAGEDVSLKYDTNYNANNSYNEENGSLLGKSTPWRDMSGDTAWPSTYTAAVYANVPDVANGCLIGFGSTTSGSSYVVIVRGEDSNKIKLMRGTTTSAAASDIVEMSALNATSSKHLIVFTNSGGKFTVYCDGVKAAEIDAITLGGGFQIGSVHGGVPSNLVRISNISDQAIKDAVELGAVRVWDRLISQREMNALVEAFPYINKAGLFNRTIEAETAALSETDAWENNDTKETVDLPQPVVEEDVTYYPMINVETTAESTLTLNESLTVDTATFGGDEALTITAGGSGNTLTVGGSLTVNSPLKIKYGEVNITSVPLKLGEDGELEIDLANCGFDPAVVGRHQLTGLADEAEGKITIINEPTAQYFKGELVHEDGSYWFKVSADREATTLYLTESATLSDNTLYAMTADGEAIMPRLFAGDVIYVKSGLTATMPATDLTIKAKFNGAGTVAVSNKTLTNSSPLFSVEEGWTGTVEFTNLTMAGNASDANTWFDLNPYGNENSKVKLAGAVGYMRNSVTFTPEVILENTASLAGIHINNGSGSTTLIFRKVSGTGNFVGTNTVKQRIAVGDASTHTGQVRMEDGKGITLGSTTNTADDKQIAVADGATITFANQEWVAENGISFGATLNIIGAAGNYISMAAEPTSLPTTITVGGQSTSLMLKYEDGKLKLIQAAATVNGVKYETFAEALSAAIAAGNNTAISIYETVENATVSIPENTNIIISDNIVGGTPVRTFSGDFVKTGAGTLTMKGWFGQDPTTVTVNEGTLVLSDDSLLSYGRPTMVAEGAVFEINANREPSEILTVYNSITGAGTVRKTGTGWISFAEIDVMDGFGGTFEVDAGTVYVDDVNLTVNNCLKINGDGSLYVQQTNNDVKLLIGENALIDISEVDLNSGFVVLGGTVSLHSSTTYKLSTGMKYETGYCDLVAGKVLCDGEEIGVGVQKLLSTIIRLEDSEYIATLVYDRKGPQTEITRLFYANESQIIHITDTMTATELNAAIAAAGITTYATVYFDDDATLELEENVTVYPILAVCEGDVNFDGTGSLGLYSIALNGDTKTIDIAEGVTITPTKSTVLDNNMLAEATITGAGTIVYDNAVPGNEKSSYQNANWTGTVWIKNYNTTPSQGWKFWEYGNEGSKLQFTNSSGWPHNVTTETTATIVLKDPDGGGYGWSYTSSGAQKCYLRKIAGDGTLSVDSNGSSNWCLVVKDVESFEGNLVTTTFPIYIGNDGTVAANGTKKIYLTSGKTATIPLNKSWTAADGITIDGTISGEGTLNGNVTFSATAVVDAATAQLTVAANKTLTFGNTMTVKVAAAPTENAPVKILNGSFTEQVFNTALTVMVVDQVVTGDFALMQKSDGVWAIVNADAEWTGGASDGNWDSPGNWSTGKVPTATSNVTIPAGTTITMSANSTARTIALNGDVTLNINENVTLSAIISGTGKLIKAGTGMLTLSGENTLTGGVEVSAGTLKANHAKALGNGGGTAADPDAIVANGATLDLCYNSGYNNALWIVSNGGTITNSGSDFGNTAKCIKGLTLNAGTSITGNKLNLYATNGDATTITLNGNTLDVTPNANKEFMLARCTVTGEGTVNINTGVLGIRSPSGTYENIFENCKTVIKNGAKLLIGYHATFADIEFADGSYVTDNNNDRPLTVTGTVKFLGSVNWSNRIELVVNGTLEGDTSIAKLTLGNGATVPVTSAITVSSTLTLPNEGTFNVDLGDAASGNFRIITAPTGYEWDTTKVTLIGTYAEDDWNISGEGTTLVVSKLPLDAKIYEADGYNFGEKVIEVDVTAIASDLTGTQIKVVTTDMTGTQVGDATLCPIDGSKGMYQVTIGGLTAGNAYNFNVTFVDSTGAQIADSKEADLENIAVGTLVKGVKVFSADATSGESVVDGGEWEDDMTIENSAYVISDDNASVFSVTDAPTGNYTVEYDLTFEEGFVPELTAETDTPIAGLTIGEGATEGTFNWYRVDSTADNGWSKLDQTVEAGHYIIRMAFTADTVTYSVKGDEEENFTTLTQNTTSAFGITSSAISSVSFQGASALAKFVAKTDDTIDTTIANENITTANGVVDALKAGTAVTLKTNVAIDTTELDAGTYNITAGKFNLSFVDGKNRAITYNGTILTIAETTISNGESAKVNSDLNLDPTVETDKPFVKAINTTNPNAVAFKLFHGTEAKEVAIDEAVNAKAKFYVESSTDANFSTVEKSPSAGVKETLEVPLPMGESKVRYYRLKFD